MIESSSGPGRDPFWVKPRDKAEGAKSFTSPRPKGAEKNLAFFMQVVLALGSGTIDR
jgi:hypothetical protein